jgi:hypothetical protein
VSVLNEEYRVVSQFNVGNGITYYIVIHIADGLLYYVRPDGIFPLLGGGGGVTGPTGPTGANFQYNITGPAAPSNPNVGDRWYDTTQGTEFVYINDGNSSQWVTPVIAPAGPTLFLTQAIDQSTATLSFDRVYYGVTYTGGTCTINLPIGNSATDGRFVIIADEAGNISYGNRGILVQGQNSQLINGEDSVFMKIDRMSLTFLYRNNSWKTI